MFLNLTQNDKTRLAFFKMTNHKPESVIFALNEIKKMADEALKATLDSAEKQAILKIKERIEAFEKKCEVQLENKWKSIEKSILRAAKEKTEEMKPTDEVLKSLIFPIVKEMVVALRPSNDELLSLIEPLIPEVKDGEDGDDGKTPEKEYLIEIMRPLVAEHLSAFFPTPKDKEEADKTLADRLYGMIVKAVAEEVGKVKDFYGGGSPGDQVRAGAGISITQNVLGQKVISYSSTEVDSTPTGSVDGVNTVYVCLSEPKRVVADGITYYDGHGYTYNSSTKEITLDIPPSQYIRAIL